MSERANCAKCGLTVHQHGLQPLVLCRKLGLLSLQLPHTRAQEVKLPGLRGGQS